MSRMDYKAFSKHFACWINILLLCYNTVVCSAVRYHDTTTDINSKSLSVQHSRIPITTDGFPNRIKNVQHFRVMETASYHLPALKDKQPALNDLPNLIAASTETPLDSKKHHHHQQQQHNSNYQWSYSKHKERKMHGNSPHLNLSLRDTKTKQDSRYSSKWRQISALGIHSSTAKSPELSKLSSENVMVSGEPPLKSSFLDQHNPVTSRHYVNEKRTNFNLTTLLSVKTTHNISIAKNMVQLSTPQQRVSETTLLGTDPQHKPNRVILLLTPTPVLSTLTTVFNETQFENYLTTEEMPLKEVNSSDIPEYLVQPPLLLNDVNNESSFKGSQSKERTLPTGKAFDQNLPPLAQPAPSTHTRYGASRREQDSRNLPYTDPPKYGTQRPPRNILSLDVHSHHHKGIKPTLMPSRSGLLHLTEDSGTTNSHKPLVTNKIKGFTKKGLDGKMLAAVTTEYLKPSEMIPDILIAPTDSQHTHPTPTKHGYIKPIFSTPTSVTAALSLKSKNKHLILSATATLDPSKMTHLCTKPCSDDANCKCCTDKQSDSVDSTEQIIPKEPIDNATPQTDVSTQKNPSKKLTLSAGFGIGMGCLIAIWLIVGPVVCLICHIKDKAKREQDIDKKYTSVPPMQENSITEALVMDELNKQFSKMKTNRENEYLWLARDKLELVSLSNADSATQTTNQYLTSPTYTSALSYNSKKWLDSDDEDDEDYDDSEDEKKGNLKYVPTVSV